MKRRFLLYVLPALLFVVFALVVLVGQNSDMLYTAQDRNEFFFTSHYFSQYLSSPFALMTYLGSFLTQFFYYPALGAVMLVLLWCAIYAATIKAFSLGARWACLAVLPVACLLASITDVGYWIYIMPLRGYWFSQSLAILCVLLMICAARHTSVRWRALWYVFGTLVMFPLLGWTTYLFALCFFATQCAESADRRMPWWQNVLGLLLAAVTPLLYGRLLYSDAYILSTLKAGVPYFESTTSAVIRPSYPFMLLAVLLIAYAVCMPLWRKHTMLSKSTLRYRCSEWAVVVIAFLFAVGIHRVFAFSDYNYLAEMRMNRAAMEDDWDTILEEAQRAEDASRTMVLLKNVALMNYGSLGTRGYLLANSGKDIHNPDSLNINVMQIAAPLVYLDYGKPQYSIRWSMENSLAYGFSPYYLKMFVRAAQETGEQRLMARYYKLLSHTLFHGEWRPKPATSLVRCLHLAFSDVIDSDSNDLERYLIENFSNAFGSQEPLVQELNLFYAMLYREPQHFWQSFVVYASQTRGANLPVHYQEAYLIMQENYPVQLPFKVQITSMVQQNYQMYKKAVTTLQAQGMSEDEIGTTLKPTWSHTYWWYIMYGRIVY